MGWVRNEWLLQDDGSYKQNSFSMINKPETLREIDEIVRIWASHQWFRTDDLIIGTPPDGSTSMYLVVFSRSD